MFSTGSALDGEPDTYLKSPDAHDDPVTFREVASFAPFDAPPSGVRVAATSTVYGADLLVSGADGQTGTGARVRKYGLARASADARTMVPKLLAEVASPASAPASLGGG